ncbi:MAG: hypothetical protein ACE5EY_07615 [Anaerolineae bacterium]
MSKFGKIVLTAGIVALLAAGATLAFAQGPDTPDAPQVTVPDSPDNGRPFINRGNQGQHGPHGPRFGDPEAMQEAIANALGISVEELQAAREDGVRLPELADSLGVDMADVEAAIQAAQVEAINQAVADGDLTQEEADQILANMELRSLMRDIFGPEEATAATAAALGISVEELQAAHEDGARLPELADELGVDMADVRDAVQTAREDAINQAVADGLITQEQADQALSHPGNGFGGHGRRDGHGPGGCDGQGHPGQGRPGQGRPGNGGFPGQGGSQDSNFNGGFNFPGQNA